MSPAVGRPPVGPRVVVRLDADLLARIDDEAARTGRSRAATIRHLLDGAVPRSGVDVAQIRRALALSPAERVRAVAQAEGAMARLRGRVEP